MKFKMFLVIVLFGWVVGIAAGTLGAPEWGQLLGSLIGMSFLLQLLKS